MARRKDKDRMAIIPSKEANQNDNYQTKRSFAMTHATYKFRFDESVTAKDMEDTLVLALSAVEGLYGRSRVKMESRFSLDESNRTCKIDTPTVVGENLALIFTVFAIKEFGAWSLKIERIARSDGDSPSKARSAKAPTAATGFA